MKKYYFIFVLVLLVVSCGKSQKQLAEEKIVSEAEKAAIEVRYDSLFEKAPVVRWMTFGVIHDQKGYLNKGNPGRKKLFITFSDGKETFGYAELLPELNNLGYSQNAIYVAEGDSLVRFTLTDRYLTLDKK